MEENKKEYSLIFWIHLFLIILSYLSFLYLDWKLILFGVLFLQIYYLLRGGCDLSFIEFGNDRDITFVWFHIHKIFPNLNQKTTKIFIRFIFPIFLIILSFFLQKIMGYIPLITI